ncbi:MAG: CapA family protein [Patescibacteria group bacterium]
MGIFNKIVKILSLVVVLLAVFYVGFIFYLFSLQDDREDYFTGLFSKKSLEQENKNYINNLPKNNDKSLNFLFFGDMMLDRHVGEKIRADGLSYIFEKLAGEENRFFQGIDLISANLEGAVTNNGAHYLPVMDYDFAFAPELIQELKNYNFNFFNLANNHFADQGERGIIETRENLDELDFDYIGCQDGKVGECSIKIMDIAGQKIGMAGFSMVYSKLDDGKMTEVVSTLASSTDLVIINIHWGVEYEHYFNKTQQNIAYKLIEAGADIIIGHHPHVAQGMEIYKGKPIFYSLGNFIFDQYFSKDTQEGLAIGINVNNEKFDIFFYPFKSKLSQAELMKDREKEEFLSNLLSWSDIQEEYIEEIKKGILIINN